MLELSNVGYLGRIVKDIIPMLQDCGLTLLQQCVSLRNGHRWPVAGHMSISFKC